MIDPYEEFRGFFPHQWTQQAVPIVVMLVFQITRLDIGFRGKDSHHSVRFCEWDFLKLIVLGNFIERTQS